MQVNKDRRRRTGRTTRMLADAIRCAVGGKAVYVILANVNQEHGLSKQYGALLDQFDIKFETSESSNFNWETMTLRGIHDCVVLVDHYAIEAQFPRIVEMLHRYDR